MIEESIAQIIPVKGKKYDDKSAYRLENTNKREKSGRLMVHGKNGHQRGSMMPKIDGMVTKEDL